MPRIIESLDLGHNVLSTPFRLIVAGGSGSGKTEFVKKLVNRNFFADNMTKIVYCYPEYLTEIPTEFNVAVHYYAGMPDTSYMASIPDGSLLILDDMMIECSKCEDIAKLFSVVARKRRISVILITQNIYQQGRHFRNIRLNATGIVLFKFRAANDSNLRLIRDLGLKDHIPRRLLDNALANRYAYIMIDIHPNRQFDFGCIRSNIFDKYIKCYYKMEYVAIPKEDFMKYFKIIETSKGKITSIKNEIAVKKDSKRKRAPKKKRKREPSESAGSESSESDHKHESSGSDHSTDSD